MIDSIRNEEVKLVREAEAGFIDKVSTDRPYIGELGIIAAYIFTAAIDRAYGAEADLRVVAARFRNNEVVILRDVPVEASKYLVKKLLLGET